MPDGKDSDFDKEVSHLIAYTEKDPLYALRVYTASWGNTGGAVTDDTFHVIASNGNVIEDLFAVGECSTARLFGDYYFGGFSLGVYTAAGHIAGEEALTYFPCLKAGDFSLNDKRLSDHKSQARSYLVFSKSRRPSSMNIHCRVSVPDMMRFALWTIPFMSSQVFQHRILKAAFAACLT